MLTAKKLYGFDDVTIIPASISDLTSRNEVTEDINRLLWVSPMDSVVDEYNAYLFYDSRLNVCLARGVWKNLDLESIPPVIISLTLEEAQGYIHKSNPMLRAFLNGYYDRHGKCRVLIDVANGHMVQLFDLCRAFKRLEYEFELGVGNIANPATYLEYAKAGADWVRAGIGTGSRCHTSSKTSVHYPMISLLDEMHSLKDRGGHEAKIIADGGFRDSSDIAKALAAGADGIMSGAIFNKTIESAGKKYVIPKKNGISLNLKNSVDNELARHYREEGYIIEVEYSGMSTIRAQEKYNGNNKKYEEGFSKRNIVEYNLEECLHEINYAIKSAFSYCNARTLREFKQNAELALINNLNNHNRL